MIDRACISINNHCNLRCTYCHFHTAEKKEHLFDVPMDIFKILDNIIYHIEKYDIPVFKLGFVGNGEPFLDYESLKAYIKYISKYTMTDRIAAYTITNGTLITEEMLRFAREFHLSVGFSLDGIPEIHNKNRCNSHDRVMNAIEIYRLLNGQYPSMNCTVGPDVLNRPDETIVFFEQFQSKITFSRMIGANGISLDEFHRFLELAQQKLNIRTGGYDCTMYGGLCGAGINNLFFANGKIYICGNCVDLATPYSSDTPLDEVRFDIRPFNRNHCYKEEML